MQALTMSCALPGIFMPIIIETQCFIDGGIMANYPVNYCVRDHTNKDEILGINCYFNNMDDTYENNVIDHESSILEFIIGFSINAMNYIHKSVKKDTIPNQINCLNDGKSLTLDVIKESISNMEMRRTWMQEGENDAKEFLSTINNTINNTTNNT
jgi:predicted acylesterase/phospholipase RssA